MQVIKKIGLGWGVALILFSLFPTLGLADTVITQEGLVIQGKIVGGMPDVITIETSSGSLNVKKEDLRILKLNDQDTIETQDKSVYKGVITTELPATLQIEVRAGIKGVSWAQISQINFEASTTTPGTVSGTAVAATLTFASGDTEQGVIQNFPELIEIETKHGTLAVRAQEIRQINWDQPDVILTQDGSNFRGEIISQIPETLEIKQTIGTLRVETAKIKTIEFGAVSSPPTPNGPTPPPVPADETSSLGLTLGAGFSYLPQVPFALGAATLEFSPAASVGLRALLAYGSRTIQKTFEPDIVATSMLVEVAGLFHLPTTEDSLIRPYLGAGIGVVTNVIAVGISSVQGDLQYLAGLAGVKLELFGELSAFAEVQYSPSLAISLRGGISRQF